MVQKVTTSFRVEEDVLYEAKLKALKNKTTLSKYLCKCLNDYVNKDK